MASTSRRREGDIRIGELVRLTGVSRATIQHYLNEKLLPRPRKTGQTMAYYDASTVERVRLIKELQRRHLPLQAIRALLEPRPPAARQKLPRMAELARRSEELEALLAPNERPLRRSEVARETGVDEAALDELERLGFVSGRRARGELRYGPCDVAVLRAIGQLNAAGLDSSRGFGVRDLMVYREAMRDLLAREVELFGRANVSRDDFVRLAQAAAVGASELVAALHRKLVTELVAERGAGNRRRRRPGRSTSR
ncbi:MAG: putative transcriptional regulator, MerR family [bacterium]|nr:putative transcriptional regulator, MerR family [bacterium]